MRGSGKWTRRPRSDARVVDSTLSITNSGAALLKPGFNTVTFNAMDDSGNISTDATHLQVIYNFGGLQPFQRLTD